MASSSSNPDHAAQFLAAVLARGGDAVLTEVPVIDDPMAMQALVEAERRQKPQVHSPPPSVLCRCTPDGQGRTSRGRQRALEIRPDQRQRCASQHAQDGNPAAPTAPRGLFVFRAIPGQEADASANPFLTSQY
jgi:hypothetical protein